MIHYLIYEIKKTTFPTFLIALLQTALCSLCLYHSCTVTGLLLQQLVKQDLAGHNLNKVKFSYNPLANNI